MATTVSLEVALVGEHDLDRDVAAPPGLLAAVAAEGQDTALGLVQRAHGPVRLRFQITGADRVAVGQRLQERLRGAGYDATAEVAR